MSQAAVDGNGNVVASVNGQFQCAGDSSCSIWNNIFSTTVDGGSAPLVNMLNGSSNWGCMRPTRVQKIGIALQGTAAKTIGKTLLAGLGGSGGAGLGKGFGFYATGSAQIAVSPSGKAAYVITYGAPGVTYPWITPASKGSGVLGGPEFGVSNATDPSQLAGLGADGSGSLAAGLGLGGDLSVSIGGSFPWTFNATLGFGGGGRSSAGGLTNTVVIPFCGN